MEATLACSDRPIEQRAPGGTGVAHTRHHGRIHLFVHPRSAAHDGRLDFGQLLRDVIHAPGDPDLTAVDDGEEDLIDPPEHMGVRKPRQRPVLVVDGMYLDRRAADVDEVTVRQLDALRVARRPRRVDDRAQVVGSDRRHAPADLTILCGSVTDPFRDLCRHQKVLPELDAMLDTFDAVAGLDAIANVAPELSTIFWTTSGVEPA